MKISVISDTHDQHEKLGALSGDVLIHCGDMFTLANPCNDAVEKLDDWFSMQNFDVILCTGGNHDIALESRLLETDQPFDNAIYLQDESYCHNGVVFYGSPWVPELSSHAFYKNSAQRAERWSMIPDTTDVLITHTPPAGVLDVSSWGWSLGCKPLAQNLARISPRLHCFGHVHASSGSIKRDGIQFVNAASVNSDLQLIRQPYVFEL